MKELSESTSYHLNQLDTRIGLLEKNIVLLEEKLTEVIHQFRNHLMRLKNQEDLDDDFILYGRKYRDLSPNRAFKIYQESDLNYILLDVSHPHYQKLHHFPEAVEIPLEDLTYRHQFELNKVTPILVISENGVNSILACEQLVELGYYNVNNISGGYKFWPQGQQLAKAA